LIGAGAEFAMAGEYAGIIKRMISGVYINLDRALERRSAIEQQLAALDLPYPVRRLAAIDGLQQKDLPAKLTPSQYGCWLSHLCAIESSIEDDGHLYVVEDDALLSEALVDLPSIIDAVDSSSNGDWDLLYLDATVVEVEDMCAMFEWTERARRDQHLGFVRVPSNFTLYGLLSYVVNSRRKRSVCRFLREHIERGKPIDSITAQGIHQGALKAYVTVPLLTCGSELARSSQIEIADDGRNLAWLLFRRLCFVQRDAESLRDLSAAVGELTGSFEEPEKLLGLLVSNRVVSFPNARFRPMLGEK
jgi:hypothetical protein